MKMEIFNNDSFGDEFLELDSKYTGIDQVGADGIPPQDIDDDNLKNKTVDKVDEIPGFNPEDSTGEDEYELILPSGKSDDDVNKDTQNSSSVLSPKFFSSLVEALKEGGVLELEEVKPEDIKSQEDFYEIMKQSIKQSEYSDLNDNQKQYLELLRDGIPAEDALNHLRTIEEFNSITDDEIENEESADLRRNIINMSFINKGIDAKKAAKLVDKIFNDGEDIQEAKDALNELKMAEKETIELTRKQAVESKKAREKADKEAIETLNKLAKETKEVIPGLQIPPNVRNNIIKGLTSPVGYNERNQPLDIISKYLHDNPIEGRFKLAYLLTVTDNFQKMNVLENKAAKKEAFKQIENLMKVRENEGPISNIDDDGGFDFSKFKF